MLVQDGVASGAQKILSPNVARVHRRYAARRKRRSHFWQGRFGAVAMDEQHLAAALRYVSLNPVRARLVERAQDWRWSSARAHLRGKDDGATALAADLKAVWSAPSTDARLKKRIVRTVIQEVVADIDDEASEIVLLTHWIGGGHTELRLQRRRRGQRNGISADILAAVRQLVLIANDDLIAGILNRNGLVTGHSNRWTRERVTALRSHHNRCPCRKPNPAGT
jgi:hypothetical protein